MPIPRLSEDVELRPLNRLALRRDRFGRPLNVGRAARSTQQVAANARGDRLFARIRRGIARLLRGDNRR